MIRCTNGLHKQFEICKPELDSCEKMKDSFNEIFHSEIGCINFATIFIHKGKIKMNDRTNEFIFECIFVKEMCVVNTNTKKNKFKFL